MYNNYSTHTHRVSFANGAKAPVPAALGHCRFVPLRPCPASSVGTFGPLDWPRLRGSMVQPGLLHWHPALSQHSGRWPYASLAEAWGMMGVGKSISYHEIYVTGNGCGSNFRSTEPQNYALESGELCPWIRWLGRIPFLSLPKIDWYTGIPKFIRTEAAINVSSAFEHSLLALSIK